MIILTKRYFNLITRLFPFMLLLVGCNPTLNITGMDISSLYTGIKNNSLHISHLYNINDSISSISIIIPAGLIKPDPQTKKFTKRGTLKYEIIGAGKQIGLVDSATFSIADSSVYQSFISHTWMFSAPKGMDYFVKATYSVPGYQEDFLLLEYFSKKHYGCQSWYRFQSESGEYIPGNISAYPVPLRLITPDSGNRILQVKFYSRNFPTPIPPFVEQNRSAFNYQPDSVFNLEIIKGKSAYFNPTTTGFYFFQTDSLTMQGPTLFRMNPGFPRVTQHSLMLESLRYLTSSKEFALLKSNPVPKLAVDSFWVSNSGRSDLATELIKKYYQRVETANQLYTSYTDGWKTDRGMVFIVIGKPSKVFRSFEQEVWIYGEYDDPRAMKFYFNKAQNPFTENDYVLIRNQYYKSTWYQNVQLWRR